MSVSTTAGLTLGLAQRAASLEPAEIPDDVTELARQSLLDWFGVTLGGSHEDAARMLLELLPPAGDPEASGPPPPSGTECVSASWTRRCSTAPPRTAWTSTTSTSPSSATPRSPCWPAPWRSPSSWTAASPELLTAYVGGIRDHLPPRGRAGPRALPAGLPRHRHDGHDRGGRSLRASAGTRSRPDLGGARDRRQRGGGAEVQHRHDDEVAARRQGLPERPAGGAARRPRLHREPRRDRGRAGLRRGLRRGGRPDGGARRIRPPAGTCATTSSSTTRPASSPTPRSRGCYSFRGSRRSHRRTSSRSPSTFPSSSSGHA